MLCIAFHAPCSPTTQIQEPAEPFGTPFNPHIEGVLGRNPGGGKLHGLILWDQKYLLASTSLHGVRHTNSVCLNKVFHFADPYKMFHVLERPGGSRIPPARNSCKELSCQCCVCFASGAQTGWLRDWTQGWVPAPSRLSEESVNESRRQHEGDSQQEPDLLHTRKIVQCLAGLTLQPSGFRDSNRAVERGPDVSWRGIATADGCMISYIFPSTSAGFSI